MIWDLQKYRDNIAILDEYGTSLTYGALDEEGRRVAEAIGRRCLVFVLCRNETGALVGWIGMMNAGIVPLLLSSHMNREALVRLLDIYQPPYMWAPEDMGDSFPDWTPVYRAFDYCLLRSHYETEYPLHPDLAMLVTTSGSTGTAKFTRWSYANFKANGWSFAQCLELDGTERSITSLPMNYIYGLTIINCHLYAGAAILATEKSLVQKEFWQFFRQREATSFGGIPYTFEMLDKMRFQQMDLPSLRAISEGGGKMTLEIHKKFAEYAAENGIKFVGTYGLAEAAPGGYLPADKAVEKLGAMGIAPPGSTYHLLDADGRTIAQPHVTGELVYQGPNVTMGYAERGEDLAKGDEHHGILETGDLARFDEDGYYYIVGRKKRFLKIYGNRVNLDEIDQMVKAEFMLADFVSAGVDDHMCLFVTDASIAEAVKGFVASKTGLNPAAFQAVVLPEIPRNDAGKTRFSELEKYYVP